jgi:hypothetical protein
MDLVLKSLPEVCVRVAAPSVAWIRAIAVAVLLLHLFIVCYGVYVWLRAGEMMGRWFEEHPKGLFGFFALLLGIPLWNIYGTATFSSDGLRLQELDFHATVLFAVVLVCMVGASILLPVLAYRLHRIRTGLSYGSWWPERICSLGIPGWLGVFSLSYLFSEPLTGTPNEQGRVAMSDTLTGALIGAGATLVAAATAALIAWKQYQLLKGQLDQEKRSRESIAGQYNSLRQTLSKGPKAFVQKFGMLIQSAHDASAQGPGEHNLIPKAHAIVSQRNSLQEELGGLEKLLNSDIDRLSNQLQQKEPSWNEVRDIVETLSTKWAFKEDEISLRIKRLLAALEVVLDVDQLQPTDQHRQ